MKKTLKGVGLPFNYEHSSCSDLVPKDFKWSPFNGDYTVYIDNGMKERTPDLSIDKKKRFGWVCESKFIIPHTYDWLVKNHEILFDKYFYKIFTCEQELLNLNSNFVYAYSGSNYPWIKKDLWALYPKTKLCSMFCSHKTMTDEHVYRHKVARYAMTKNVDVYGGIVSAPQPHSSLWDTKLDGIKDYMFHIVIENGVTENYFTEKFTDAIAAGAVPVYRGAAKVLELFDPDGIIILEPGREEEIINSLTPELYNTKLQHVQNNLEILKTLKMSDDYLFDCINAL
jgi:hypothetical protein